MSVRPRHPSGRPIHPRIVNGGTRWRVPDKGYVIPQLQEDRRDLSLIGFHHHFVEKPVDDDEE